MPLTEELYRRMVDRLGTVLISNEGEELVLRNAPGAMVSQSISRMDVSPDQRIGRDSIVHSGEYYRASCPKCGDTRHRLFVNHRAVEFPWLIHCFNNGCYNDQANRRQLLFFLFNTNRPRNPFVRRGRRDTAVVGPVQPPGDMVPVHLLPLSHPANLYLAEERGFDPWELGNTYRVSYCGHSSTYPQCSNKLIVPVMMQGRMVGWQARFIGERHWKASSVPKYWDMPGMPKRLMLYNYDNASRCPWVSLVEGVTDVWSSGDYAMALLGKSLTFAQKQILAYPPFRGKPVVLMLDGEAYLENEMLAAELRQERPNRVVTVRLPAGVDPGQLGQEANLDLIRRSALDQGVDLPPLGGVA